MPLAQTSEEDGVTENTEAFLKALTKDDDLARALLEAEWNGTQCHISQAFTQLYQEYAPLKSSEGKLWRLLPKAVYLCFDTNEETFQAGFAQSHRENEEILRPLHKFRNSLVFQ